MTDPIDVSRRPIAYLHVLHGDGSMSRSGHVACPRLGGSVPLSECAHCSRFVKITPGDATHGEELHCWADAAPEETDHPLALPRITAASLMCVDVVSVQTDVSLDSLGLLFLQTGLAAVPVIDPQERLLGFVDRDQVALAVQVETRTSGRTMTVDDILLPFAVAVPETTSLTQAAAVMAYEGQHRVAVTATTGTVVGVLSASDILAWLARADGHVLPTQRGPKQP